MTLAAAVVPAGALSYWSAMPAPAKLKAAQRRAAESLKYADSYSRGDALVRAYRVRHPHWPEMLRDCWSDCDAFPPPMLAVLEGLAKDPAARRRVMRPEALAFLEALPEQVTVWRGCYSVSVCGFSWSTSREVAAKFPFLLRYRRRGDTPLLLRGEIARERILFVTLGRNEFEVVTLPGAVREVGRMELGAG